MPAVTARCPTSTPARSRRNSRRKWPICWQEPKRRIRLTSPTGCRYRRSWSGGRRGWRNAPWHVPRSKLVPRRATTASRPSTRRSWPRARQKPRPPAKNPGGNPPEPPVEGPLPTEPINLTDEESRIMAVAGGGFEPCYNAKAVVAEGSLLVVASDVVQAPNDKQQLQPMLSKLDALPDELGKVTTLLADTGNFSAANVSACAATEIEPLIAMERQAHYPPLNERFADAPEAPDNPTPVEAMAHRLQTPAGG